MRKGLSTTALLIAVMGVAYAQTTAAGVVKAVVITGNQYISREAILSAMSQTEGKTYQPEKLLVDKRSIEDLGLFKDVKVLSRPLTDSEWEIQVMVAENPRVKEIAILGNTVVKTEEILPLITQGVDQVFNFRTIGPTVDAISKLYEKKGYFAQAEIAPLEDSPGTLGVKIVERAVNEIKITGLSRTRPSIMRRMLKTKPNQAFSENVWANDRRRLESTGWFEQLEAASEPTEYIGKFNLMLDVKEMRTAQIGFGATLDPRSRLAGSLRFNDSNWLGAGQSVGLLLQQDTAGKGLSASLDFVNPYLDSRDTSVAVRVYSRINSYFAGSGIGGTSSPNNEQFDERRNGASLAFGRPISRDWSATVGATFETIRTIDQRIGNLSSNDFIQQDGDLLGLQFQLTRDRRDVPLDPAEGDYFRMGIEPYSSRITKIGGAVGQNTELLGRHPFLRASMEYKAFFSKRPSDPRKLTDPRQVLAVRLRLGAIKGTVPFFEQLFAGGSDSLRGYSDQRFWGKKSMLASVEYRMPIQKSFNLIGFVDYGGAWDGYGTLNNFSQSRTLKLHLGYGAGVAFRTPLGPIRLDFGFNEKGGSRTHFSIGTSF